MSNVKEAVIISAARTPTGKFQGALKGFTAPELGAIAIKEAVKRAGVDPEDALRRATDRRMAQVRQHEAGGPGT